jgi:hypothetical protein
MRMRKNVRSEWLDFNGSPIWTGENFRLGLGCTPCLHFILFVVIVLW